MTKNPFDQFSKQVFQAFLKPYGEVRTNFEVPGEPRFIDVLFTPSQDVSAIPESMGLMRHMASKACLIEPFRNQPRPKEIRSCQQKLLYVQSDFVLQAQRDEDTIPDEELPLLWVLTPTTSKNFLKRYGGAARKGWLNSIYFSPEGYYIIFVAIHKLPETSDTLLFRLFGKGRVQEQAVREIFALPETDERFDVIKQLLSVWRVTKVAIGEYEKEDEDLAMLVSEEYKKWEEATERRGMEREQRTTLENLLLARFSEIDEQLQAIIPSILALPKQEYTALILQLSSLSREELLARFNHLQE